MGVLKFGFPERSFYDNKEDNQTETFATEVGLVLASTPPFDYPMLQQVKSAAFQTSYEVDQGMIEENGTKKWACSLFKNGHLKTPIYIENVEVDTDKVTCLHFERGDDQAIIEFLQHLSQYCGSILLYEDTGFAKLIRHVKD
ncbi:hypothetical protein DYU11_20395 [Fibrisoma montanum]|uniref:Uncharacterized protein n=1 Tax=Fibrisoma montanum TaxID=2305895 RepID=A0A418M3U3_9BACT|nr:hypothetical protein [Fibrisoma montanum]RIV20411.1 hypothetical protein DYU11_20395 [Fibrisoma montanum]